MDDREPPNGETKAGQSTGEMALRRPDRLDTPDDPAVVRRSFPMYAMCVLLAPPAAPT
jgi:hypothetical protein